MIKMLDDVLNRVNSDFGEVIFLSEFGSKLYGLNTSESDRDFFGLYIPKRDLFFSNSFPDKFFISTGNYKRKNNKNDVDIKIFSLQYWYKQLQNGDPNAIDVLFAPSKSDSTIIYTNIMEQIYNRRFELMTYANIMNGLKKYVFKQWSAYSVCGTELYVYDFAINYFKENSINLKTQVANWAEDLVMKYRQKVERDGLVIDYQGNSNLERMYILRTENNDFLNVNKKYFAFHIWTEGFLRFMKDNRQKYINRRDHKRRKKIPNYVNFKAISHSFRIIEMMKEFIQQKDIIFPLRYNTEFILDVKYGNYTNIKSLFYKLIKDIKSLDEQFSTSNWNNIKSNTSSYLLNDFIFSLYKNNTMPLPTLSYLSQDV